MILGESQARSGQINAQKKKCYLDRAELLEGGPPVVTPVHRRIIPERAIHNLCFSSRTPPPKITPFHENYTMDPLVSSLDKLLKCKNEDPARFYTYLSDYTLTEHDEKHFIESFIPKVYYLYDKKVLRKDLVYLSLLAGENHHVLEKFIEYDKSIFVLNIDDPVSLFDYYVYEKKHWVYEIVNNPSGFDKLIPLKTIYNKLKMIKFIYETNFPEVDIEYLHSLSAQIDVEVLDDFWKFYVDEIIKFIEVVRFCKPLLKREVSDSELFAFGSSNALLDTLSRFVDLGDPARWDTILNRLKLNTNEDELNVFTGFMIIATLIRLLLQENYNTNNQKKDFVNSVFEDVKTWLLSLQNKQLQVELLENVFSLLFHRSRNEFTCKEKEIRFILFLLKSVIEELQLKKTHEKTSPEHKKLSSLMNLVTDSLWRLDLIINTKMTPKIEERLLNYMLAPPASLIHLCLKRRNFERAHQVIQFGGFCTSLTPAGYGYDYIDAEPDEGNAEDFFQDSNGRVCAFGGLEIYYDALQGCYS
ncbi:hypothetical protein Zmor_020282 [Zophobas morio]|uniref:Uncharacterized protein n=1 Tax=Zophobas morio TaxID=2755281 RepID=A0AA38I3D9_9CUCU|nr:hypothetical protein Zmor_020282 [Zophobas morio]